MKEKILHYIGVATTKDLDKVAKEVKEVSSMTTTATQTGVVGLAVAATALVATTLCSVHGSQKTHAVDERVNSVITDLIDTNDRIDDLETRE